MRETRDRRMVVDLGIVGLMLCVAAAGALAETGGASPGASAWASHLGAVDEALARGDASGAASAREEAYRAAVASRGWEAMLAVGQASLRIGEATGARRASQAEARRAYLSALFRARDRGSLDGVLRAAEAFAALGDLQVVEQCVRLAERLATESRDPKARERVRATVTRLALGGGDGTR